MKSFCQTIILSFVLLAGLFACSSLPEKSIYKASPTWFNLRKSIRLANGEGVVQPHLFYDTVPGLDSALSHINFLPLSLAHTDKAYGFDPLSGQRFFSHFWCGQTDAWKKRGTTPRRPTFTRGVVPRHFDQLHGPQQIIVFGDASHYDMKKPEVYRVRVVGGVVEQICKSGRCSGTNEWVARLVLVGVNDHDRSFRDVDTIRELQDEINWRDVQNQLENHEGHNVLAGNEETPSVKVGNLLENKEVMDYLLQRSVILNSKELAGLSKQCGLLYWRLWRDVGRFTTEDARLAAEDIKKKIALRERLRKSGKPTTFHQLLSAFLATNADALTTCSRLVYPGDPGGDYERFWFLSWVTQYARLHREGWLYNCTREMWEPENAGKEAMEYLRNATGRCSDKGFDKAMETMPGFLRNQRLTSGDRWAFIEWDNNTHGTHKKLFSWVRVPERKMTCSSDMNEKVRARWQEQPDGESWFRRYRRSNSGKDYDYIY